MADIEINHGINTLEYHLVSVEKIDTPEDMPAGNWHRYIIDRGSSTMKGMRSGSLLDVRKHAEDFVKALNERSMVGNSQYATRKKK